MLYVGINVALVNFAPIVHRLSLSVRVVAADTSAPISGATVGWAGAVHLAARAVGTTGGDGVLMFEETIQENPYWFWPPIGTFGFHGRTLEVKAVGYRAQSIMLSEALPEVSYAHPVAELRVRMQRE